jgi:hypothetical protein
VIEIDNGQCHLYFRIAARRNIRGEYFWGVTNNTINRLGRHNRPWYLVLLIESGHQGILLTENYVINHIRQPHWHLSPDGDYRVLYNPRMRRAGLRGFLDVPNHAIRFNTYRQLIRILNRIQP